MAKANSTRGDRPRKPYPDFPLTWHPAGYWAKRIRGKLHYFGPRWGDWQTALDEYQKVRDDLHAGRTPRQDTEGLTVRYLCNHFLTDRNHRLDAGELTERSFSDYRKTAERLVAAFGPSRLVADLRTDDFLKLRDQMTKQWGPTTLAGEIQRVRVLFNYAWQAELIEKPVRYGPSFRRPSKRVMRQHRAAKGKRIFAPQDIHDLLEIATSELRAMILLAVNCGFGNRDCATLPVNAVDLQSGWVTFPRPKTGIGRRCWLWPESVDAIKAVLADRKEPKDDAYRHLAFVTKYRTPWYRADGTDDPISKEFRKLLNGLGIYRPGLSFYALRHVFRTVADETKDQPAIDHVMGHAPTTWPAFTASRSATIVCGPSRNTFAPGCSAARRCRHEELTQHEELDRLLVS